MRFLSQKSGVFATTDAYEWLHLVRESTCAILLKSLAGILDSVFMPTGELCFESPTGPFVAQRESGICFRSVFYKVQAPQRGRKSQRRERGANLSDNICYLCALTKSWLSK